MSSSSRTRACASACLIDSSNRGRGIAMALVPHTHTNCKTSCTDRRHYLRLLVAAALLNALLFVYLAKPCTHTTRGCLLQHARPASCKLLHGVCGEGQVMRKQKKNNTCGKRLGKPCTHTGRESVLSSGKESEGEGERRREDPDTEIDPTDKQIGSDVRPHNNNNNTAVPPLLSPFV